MRDAINNRLGITITSNKRTIEIDSRVYNEDNAFSKPIRRKRIKRLKKVTIKNK